MIVSLGEALIDIIHSSNITKPTVRVGGSPYNVAIALSCLEVDTGFLCPISKDPHGQLLASVLEEHGVQRCVKQFVASPTAIAEAFIDSSGHPRYVFYREDSADRALQENPPIKSLPEQLKALHFGSLVLAQEIDWPAWRAAIVKARANGIFIAFDLNLRLALIDDLDRYRRRVEEAVELSDLIKASDEDLSLLTPGCVPEQRIQEWCASTRIIVLTEGERGAQIWTQGGEHTACRETGRAPILDTVGAGDTFQAALLAWLWHRDAFTAPLGLIEAQELLTFANQAALLNCMKIGCQPPMLSELGLTAVGV